MTTDREVIGIGERGEVALITKPDARNGDNFVVRMGAFTIHDGKDKKAAQAIAKALVH